MARKNKLCFNCLSKGHSVDDCPSRHSCRECGRKHHSLLHRPAAASNPPATVPQQYSGITPVNNSSSVSQPSTTSLYQHPSASVAYIPATALATVVSQYQQRKARVLLDSGSGITLITSRLAQALKAKKQRVVHNITGLNGTKCLTSKYAISCTLKSALEPGGEEVHVLAHVVDKITSDYGPQDLSSIRSQPFLEGKKLADPEFGQSGRIDMLLSMADSNRCTFDQSESTPDRSFRTWNSIFGWIVGGQTSSPTPTSPCMKITSVDARADSILQRFWQQEEVPGESQNLTTEDQQALEVFKDTTTRDEHGRYTVTLPRKKPPRPLGESRQLAVKRYQQNKRSLTRKEQWNAFHQGLDEYRILGHAELVPACELTNPKGDVFYLPTHGVVKESSSTTKLRIVFDGSAQSSNGHSLNDVLLPGPSLYPLLSSIISKFRLHKIGMSADISKMFREVGLAVPDRDLHRFIHENEDGQLQDWRMCRVTFGITSSPFLASKVLLQVAEDHAEQYPQAAEVVRNSFYVDDCLTGAATLAEAEQLRSDLNVLLSLGCLTLRKWRSNSPDLLALIPPELKEVDSSTLSLSPSDCAKTLGIHWNSSMDTFHVCTPTLTQLEVPTKRQLASAVGKTFDVMGWYAPATVQIKILLQQVWKSKINWDDPLPTGLLPVWEKWSKELPMITNQPVPRRYSNHDSPVIQSQLHGFCDASQAAYGGVIYLRMLHQDCTVSVSLVTSKTKVAPLSGSTIPRLELSGALLLSKLIHQTAKDLDVLPANIFTWCDSSAVLGWINMAPSRMKTYVANRVSEIIRLVPSEHWRYVATQQNPADLASRGMPISHLLSSNLWWQGPKWLHLPPSDWPRRPDINRGRELPELKPTVLIIQPPLPDMELWNRYSSFHKLVVITAWCRRFILNCKGVNVTKGPRLTSSELDSAKTSLFHLSQSLSYPSELNHLSQKKSVSNKSSILSLSPLLGRNGLMRVGGRLGHADVSSLTKHPIVLCGRSPIAKLLVRQVHLDSGHAGIGTMLAILAHNYHITGLKSLLRQISRSCVVCQKAYARSAAQLMGQLPPERLNPAPPFTHVGIDFAGPLLMKRGSPRKPTMVKVYICLFLCFFHQGSTPGTSF